LCTFFIQNIYANSMDSNSGLRNRRNTQSSSSSGQQPANSRHFILTVPHYLFTPYLPHGIAYIKGQLECSASGFLHWQLIVSTGKSCRISAVVKIFGTGIHVESIFSEGASDYVWKDDTAVEGTRFELGKKPFQRGVSRDWDAIRVSAQAGTLEDVPSDIYVRFDMGLFV